MMALGAVVCVWVMRAFIALYLLALALFLVGTFGLFGQTRDPLSGVFLMPLGLPWNRFVDFAPQSAWPWLAALAPLLNIGILAALCRWARS